MKETINKFRKILRKFEREIAFQNNDCCNTGISMAQCHLLLDIEKKESTSVKELAILQGLDKSTISRTVDGLYNIGLINRDTNPESRRQSIISLTKNGEKACCSINEMNNSFFTEVFEGLTAKEIQCFSSAFEKVTNNMSVLRTKKDSLDCC